MLNIWSQLKGSSQLAEDQGAMKTMAGGVTHRYQTKFKDTRNDGVYIWKVLGGALHPGSRIGGREKETDGLAKRK